MRRSQRQQRLASTIVLLTLAAGCGKTSHEAPASTGETITPVSDRAPRAAACPGDATANPAETCTRDRVEALPLGRYRVRTTNGKSRVYYEDQAEDGGMLIRCSPVAASSDADTAAAIAARENEPTRLWLACTSRVSTAAFPDALTQHDAWLETSQRLEEQLEQDAEHLGVLRDLIVAYLHLLSFEASSSLGSNLCLLAGRRISEFEVRAAPLDPPDRELVNEGRVLLFHAMRLYPCAAELLRDSKVAARSQGLRHLLEALGQSRFTEQERSTVGPFTLRTFRTLGDAPDAGLLWEELHLVLSGQEPAAPESTVAYALVRQGSGAQTRYYLYFRALNRSQLVAAFGANRPTADALRHWVEAAASEGLSAIAEAKP